MPLRSYVPIAIAMVMAAGLSVLGARVAVDRVETSARIGIARAISDGGHGWAQASVDGLRVILTGTAPDEAARFGVISAAGTVIDATRIVDRMSVRPAREIEAPEFKIEILRNLDGISLIGLVPASMDRAEVFERIGRFADVPVTDLLEEGNYPIPRGWTGAVSFALDAMARLPRSKVSVTATSVSITGIVDSEQVRRQVEAEIGRQVPASVRLDLDISAPRPVIAPFTVRFVIENGTPRFDACAAETEEMRGTILAAARDAGYQGRNTCEIGLGAPSLDWGTAVAFGISELAGLGAGSVTYSASDVSLVAPHTVSLTAFDGAVGRLERRLPDGFSLTAVRSPAPESEEDETATSERPVFEVSLDPETGAALSGRLPTERARLTVESVAHAHFGRVATQSSARLASGLPAGWTLRVVAALDALSYLSEGNVRVEPNSLSIKGSTGREDAAGIIARLLSERLGTGATYDIDVNYEEALDPEAGLPTPEECVTTLNSVLGDKKITFEPGSATVDTGGLATIDKLVELLRPCQSVRMEIAGHTDSQGRESMNMRLSQERADAVLNAIMARRILTSNLTAKGYGESVPIADNGTEEGREENRRIEFTLISEPAEQDPAPAGSENGAGEAADEDQANEQN